MIDGRRQAKIVSDYLEALRTFAPKRGRRRTPESIANRLEAVEKELIDADALAELKLRQERVNLLREQETIAVDQTANMAKLESAFCEVARAFSDHHGIAYTTWREIGVEPAVLKAANIAR